tara:strand:+ start:294 stop:419 length:126 start_codon:yes stop_codon:yes gene_type:complete
MNGIISNIFWVSELLDIGAPYIFDFSASTVAIPRNRIGGLQ